jgi:hypothetical protein
MRSNKKKAEMATPYKVETPLTAGTYEVPEPAATTPIPMVVEAIPAGTEASIAAPAKKAKAPAKPKAAAKTPAKAKAPAEAPAKAKAPARTAKPKVTVAK